MNFNFKQNYVFFSNMVLFTTIYIFIAVKICIYPIISYQNDTKQKVMPKILQFWQDFTPNTKFKLTDEIINNSNLFTTYTRNTTYDSFAGKYKNTNVYISENSLDFKGTSRRSKSRNIFNGILIYFKLNKIYNARTILHSKNFLNLNDLQKTAILFSLICIMLMTLGVCYFKNYITSKGMFLISFLYIAIIISCFELCYQKQRKEKISLEDVKFNKNWKISSDNQLEARYLLTPKFMENIQNLKKYFNGKDLSCGFWNDNFLIAITIYDDMFETTSLFTSALSYKKLSKVVTQFYNIFSIIDTINNDHSKMLRRL